jgi:dinuclear metal center YbgI/SA1388 family protein
LVLDIVLKKKKELGLNNFLGCIFTAMTTITVSQIANALQALAPTAYQESYDNVGVLVGQHAMHCSGVLIALDCTEAIIAEAIQHNCNVIVCHHPILFKGLKKINGNNYVERVVIAAIKNDIAILACHTNLDNMLHGVNAKMCEKLGLINTKILLPSTGTLRKLYTYVPDHAASDVRQGLFEAGAGHIGNYSQCSFNTNGFGTFAPNALANPTIGKPNGQLVSIEETKLEVIYPKHLESNILQKLNSYTYYEEKAYEIVEVLNNNQTIGAGMIGDFAEPLSINTFLDFVKKTFQSNCIRYTNCQQQTISKVALCGGSGSFLLPQAMQHGADAYITADFKYHEFFDADNQIMITDIGHYESEQFTSEIFYEYLREKFPNFAIQITSGNTNPIQYF